MIQLKDHKVLKAVLHGYHKTLQTLAEWYAVRYSRMIITEAWRDDEGVHGALRAIDVRSHNYKDPEAIVADLNTYWTYDPERPIKQCALYHAVCPKCGFNNRVPCHDKCSKCQTSIKDYWHIHLQVHDWTKYNNNGKKLKKWEGGL